MIWSSAYAFLHRLRCTMYLPCSHPLAGKINEVKQFLLTTLPLRNSGSFTVSIPSFIACFTVFPKSARVQSERTASFPAQRINRSMVAFYTWTDLYMTASSHYTTVTLDPVIQRSAWQKATDDACPIPCSQTFSEKLLPVRMPTIG